MGFTIDRGTAMSLLRGDGVGAVVNAIKSNKKPDNPVAADSPATSNLGPAATQGPIATFYPPVNTTVALITPEPVQNVTYGSAITSLGSDSYSGIDDTGEGNALQKGVRGWLQKLMPTLNTNVQIDYVPILVGATIVGIIIVVLSKVFKPKSSRY